jgi:hypothetical protein
VPNALVLRDLEGIARISNISCVSIGAPKNRFLRIHANTREGSARKWLRVTLSDTDRCGGLLCPPDRPCPRQRQVNGLLALRYPSAHVPFKDNSRIEQDHATAAEVRQAAFVTAADESGLADTSDPGNLTRRYGVLKLLQAVSDGIYPRSNGRFKRRQHFSRRGQYRFSALPASLIYSPFRSASPAWLFGSLHYGNSDVTRVAGKRHEGNESHVCSSESTLATRALKREGHSSVLFHPAQPADTGGLNVNNS